MVAGHLDTTDELWRRWLQLARRAPLRDGRDRPRRIRARRSSTSSACPVGADEFLAAFTWWPRSVYPGAIDLLASCAALPARERVEHQRDPLGPLRDAWSLDAAFHHNFPSHQVGKLKPDAEYFEHVLDALDVPAQRVLFIDDNAINVDAAARLGIVTRRVAGVGGARAGALPSSDCPRGVAHEPPSHAATRAPRKRGRLRVALIGAGKFGSMYLAQAKHTPASTSSASPTSRPTRARASLARVGWPAGALRGADRSPTPAQRGTTCVTDDALALIAAPDVEIVIDATGNPAAGIRHVLACCAHGKHIVMVNVEADALAGPLLAQRARDGGHRLFARVRRPAGADLRDGRLVPRGRLRSRRRGQGHEVPARVSRVDAGHRVAVLRLHAEMVAAGDFNAQMFNSFLDGTKSAIEMAAVANATGLTPAPDGLALPAVRRRRPAARAAAARRRRRARSRGTGRSDLERRARRPPGVPRPALGRVRDVSRRRRSAARTTCAAAFANTASRPIRRALLRDVQAVSRDRARARHQRRVGGLAPRADGPGAGVARRRRGDREARPRRGRDARRRRRLHGVRQAACPPRRRCARRPAARPRARREARARRSRRATPVRWDDVAYDASDDAVRFRREMEATLG